MKTKLNCILPYEGFEGEEESDGEGSEEDDEEGDELSDDSNDSEIKKKDK